MYQEIRNDGCVISSIAVDDPRLSYARVNAFLSNLITQVSEIAETVQRWSAKRSPQPPPETL